jgi:hypothetical protein
MIGPAFGLGNCNTNSSAIIVALGQQMGDPVRAAEVVIKVLQSPTPPAHLVLGRDGVENAEKQSEFYLVYRVYAGEL